MSISSITSTSSSLSTTSSTSSTSSTVLGTFDTMMTLLLKQLETQDPSDPMDTSSFTSQLVSLSSLEQQTQTNSLLTDLNSSLSGFLSGNAAYNYLGRTVEVESDTAPLQNGSASWAYDLPTDADSVSVTITDSSGTVVYSGSASTDAGSNSFSWDGSRTDGSTATSGSFTLSVTATTDGVSKSIDPRAIGKVTGVDSSSGTALLSLGGVDVAMDDVVSLI